MNFLHQFKHFGSGLLVSHWKILPHGRNLLLLMLLGFSLTVQAQKEPRLQFSPSTVKAISSASAQRSFTGVRKRSDLMKRLSGIIEDLRRQGPPPPDCMEG